jgi:hypothetical protein
MVSLYFTLKCFFTVSLSITGALLVLHALGVVSMPEFMQYTHGAPRVDKFAAGAKLLGFHGPVALFTGFLGTCKLTAAAGFWVQTLEQTVTALASLLYLCVAIGHWYIDGDIVAPLVLAVLVFVKLVTYCPPEAKVTKSHIG